MSDEGVARYSYKINVSYIAVGDGFSAKTATLLSLCDISPNRGITLTSRNVTDISIYNSGNRFIQIIRFFHSICLRWHTADLPVEALDKFWFILHTKKGTALTVPCIIKLSCITLFGYRFLFITQILFISDNKKYYSPDKN